MEDLSLHPAINELFTKMTNGTTVSGVPFYKNGDGSAYRFYLFLSHGSWGIGPDLTSKGVKSTVIFQILFLDCLLDLFKEW